MKLYKFGIGVIILGLLLIPSLSFSQAKVGTTGVNFLELGVSAQSMHRIFHLQLLQLVL